MINITELNKLRSRLDKNKNFLDEANYNGDDNKKYSVSLTMSILMDYFGLNQNEAFDSVTDGGDDNKFDGFYFSDDEDELTQLIVIQSKYKNEDGSTGTFDDDEIKLCIANCKLFLAGQNFQLSNPKLAAKIDQYRELLASSGSPSISIKLFFGTNGIIHEGHKLLQEVLDAEKESIYCQFADATKYGAEPEIKDGKLLVNLKNDLDRTDDIFNIGDNQYSGRVVSCSARELMQFYEETGESILLNQNVRYLLKKSDVNKDIKESFISDPTKFCYLNNGITLICENFTINPTGLDKSRVDLVKPSIVNGGQTISTLYELYKNPEHSSLFDVANLLIRIYEVPSIYRLKIAKATNSQNPISVVDLHANDEAQNIAKKYFSFRGIGLITKIGEDTTFSNDTITNENLLQAYAAIYKNDPATAKLSKRGIFNKYYSQVFNDSTSSETCKELFRAFEVKRFIEKKEDLEKSLKTNAIYSIMYAMKLLNANVINANIPSIQLTTHLESAIEESLVFINEIIDEKQVVLGSKFSLNNLFKGNEIKDLLDLKVESKTV